MMGERDLGTILKQVFSLEVYQVELIKKTDILVYKATCAEGQFGIKLYPADQAIPKARTKAIRQYLKDMVLNHPELALTKYLSDHTHITAFEAPDGSGSQPYFLSAYHWIDGQPIEVITPEICGQIGKIMALLHTTAIPIVPSPHFQRIDDLLVERIESLIVASELYDLLDTAERTALTQNMAGIRQTLLQEGYQRNNFGLIHSDLHFGNWVQTSHGLLPIDFDEMAYGHYLTDITVVLCEMMQDIVLEHQLACEQALLAAYNRYRPLTDNWEPKIQPFKRVAAALYLHWACDCNHKGRLQNTDTRHHAIQSLRLLLEST